MRTVFCFTLVAFLISLTNTSVVIPSLFNHQKHSNTLAGPKKTIKRDSTSFFIDRCPGQHMPINATKFYASWRTLANPQSWVLACYVDDPDDEGPNNRFVSWGKCNDHEIAFEDIGSTLHPYRVACVSNEPTVKAEPRLSEVGRKAIFSPPGHNENTKYKYIQVVLTRHASRSAFYTPKVVALEAWNHTGGFLKSNIGVNSSSVSIYFPASAVQDVHVSFGTADKDDEVDAHLYFSNG